MFLLSEQIRKEAQRIIEDEIDNDILLIVAPKGVGKTMLLNEIYGSASYNKNLIVVTGQKVEKNVCCLKRCFVEGIVEYVSRNNRIETRHRLFELIDIPWSAEFKTLINRKSAKTIYERKLCEFNLRQLKEIYCKLAKGLPLVIISSSMVLTNEEVEYLQFLDNDPLGNIGARITFVIGLRAIPESIRKITKIINSRQKGVWVMPLMPDIDKKANQNDLRSMATISINKAVDGAPAKSVDLEMLVDYLNYDTYEAVRRFIDSGLNPQKIHILANQEISLSSYDYLRDVTRDIYNTPFSRIENGLVLPYDNKLLWLDVLSYYFALGKELDTVIKETQKLYFLLINKIVYGADDIHFEKLKRNSFLAFIHEAETETGNNIADGFAKYYADFAKLTKVLFSQVAYNYGNYEENLTVVEVLERVSIDFSAENIVALQEIYDATQICLVLDIGMETLTNYLGKVPLETRIPDDIMLSVNRFARLCIKEMYKWNDLTLTDKLMNFIEVSGKRDNYIHLKYSDIVMDVYRPMARLIKERIFESIAKGSIIMNKIEQNLMAFWSKNGKAVVEKYQDKLDLPLGNTLSDDSLNQKLAKSEFLVLTANSVESAIITREFMDSCNVKKPERITSDYQSYQFFTFKGHNIVHIIPQRTSSFSEHGSADAVRAAIRRINDAGGTNLRAIFSLGVAYGKTPKIYETDHAQDIGDVLISNRIVRWDAFIKLTDGKLHLDDRDFIYIGDEILGGCVHYLKNEDFPSTKEANIGQFRWFLGTILSGNMVLSDEDFKQKLLSAAVEYGIEKSIVGGEMEGSGIWFEQRDCNIPIMIIKGICDWGALKNGWDFVSTDEDYKTLIKKCIQALCCENAFKVFAFIMSQVYGER